MGVVYSLDDQLDFAGQQSVVNTLSKCHLESVQTAYDQLHTGYVGEDCVIFPSTVAHSLPLPISIATTLVNLLKDAESDAVQLKDCFNVLAFFACGSADDRTRLFFTIHGWNPEEADLQQVDCDALEESLLRLLLAVHRVFQADPWIQISDSGNGGVCNLVEVTGALVDDLCDFSGCSAFSFSDIRKWLLVNPPSCLAAADDMYPTYCSDMGDQVRNDNASNNASARPACCRWERLARPEGSPAPSCRSKHAVALHGGCVYLYGGRDGTIGHKDLWRLQIASNTWNRMTCGGDPPFLLQDHSMVTYNGKLYVFGGEFSSYLTNDAPLWVLDIAGEKWTRPPTPPDVSVPRGRRGHTAVITNHQMHIYGGFLDLKGSSSELWTYDLEHQMWHLCWHGDEGPGARHAHSAIIHDNAMWVYGGMSDLAPRNDLWRWNFKLRSWTKLKTKNGPSFLASHSACKVPSGMILYGGECGGIIQSDLWMFTFGSQTWQRLSCGRLTPTSRSQHCVVVLPSFLLQQAWLTGNNDRSLSAPALRQLPATKPDPFKRPKSSPVFHNSVAPADPQVEIVIRQFGYGSHSGGRGKRLDGATSKGKAVSNNVGSQSKSADKVHLLGADECSAHLVEDVCKCDDSEEAGNISVEDRAMEIRKHLRQIRKVKTSDSVSLCRLLSSTSDSSEEWLTYDNCVPLDISGRCNSVGEECNSVIRSGAEGYQVRGTVAKMNLMSVSTESILSMTHNANLPSPHWLSNDSMSSKGGISHGSMAKSLKSQSWDSLLRVFSGMRVSCTDIDIDTDPKALEMKNMINSTNDLIIEDLEDSTSNLSFTGSFESTKVFKAPEAINAQIQQVGPAPLTADATHPIAFKRGVTSAFVHRTEAILPDLLINVSDTELVKHSNMTYRTRSACKEGEAGGLTDRSTTTTTSANNTSSSRERGGVAKSNEIELMNFSHHGECGFSQRHNSQNGFKRYLSHVGVRTCDSVRMYVFGGKESESCNIGINPLPVWRLDIHDPATGSEHAEPIRK